MALLFSPYSCVFNRAFLLSWLSPRLLLLYTLLDQEIQSINRRHLNVRERGQGLVNVPHAV
jgi:hypothetical protein